MTTFPLLVVSARTGDGIRSCGVFWPSVSRHETPRSRNSQPTSNGRSRPLAESCTGKATGVRREDRAQLLAALEEAAGVPTVVRAVGDAHRRRGALATGWPFVRWLRRFRPDPLKRLRLPESPQPQVRTSLPPPTDVQRAQVASAARRLADGATEGLPQPWPRLARRLRRQPTTGSPTGSTGRRRRRSERLARPRWWRPVGLLQSLLAVAVAAGAVGSPCSPCSAGSGSRTSSHCPRSRGYRSPPGSSSVGWPPESCSAFSPGS